MPQTYSEFDVVEQDGQRYIVGQPAAEHEEPVRFSGRLEETEGIDATFRDVIKALIQQDLSGALNLEADTGGSISRSEAITTLLDAENAPVSVQSESQAEAIIDYFIENDILREDGTDVVVLSDPESLADLASQGSSSDDETTMLLNWMSAIEGCTTKIQETIDTVEEVEGELREQIGDLNVSEKTEEYQRKRKEVAQRLMNLTNGGELDRADLTESERAEYDRLEHRLFHLESMIDSVSGGGELDEEIEKMINDLGMQVKNLQDTQDSLEVQLNRLEKVYKVNEYIDYQEAKEMAEHLSKVASAVAGVDSAAERAENEDTLQLAQSILGADESEALSQQSDSEAGTEERSAEREQGF